MSATLLGLVVTACSTTPTAQNNSTPTTLRDGFGSAAKEFQVPENVLLAVSYNLTNWQFDGSKPNEMGGYGPMGLVAGTSDNVGAKGSQTNMTSHTNNGSNIDMAARAAGVSADAVRTDPTQNIRAGAALLAADAKAVSGSLPSDETGWYSALARYAHAPSTAGADAFTDDVFATLRSGASGTASDGEKLGLPADPTLATPTKVATKAYLTTTGTSANNDTSATPAAECPSTLDCRFVPAAYDWASTDHSDPNNYGNYDPANRPSDGDGIQYIIIHDTESAYDAAIQAFQNPSNQASTNYVIGSAGQVTQMVSNSDLSWDVANWTANQHSISIEHAGYATKGASSYTSAMYQSSAALVRYLAAKYHIPLDRQHIIAHEDVPGELTAMQAAQHWDPGPFWNWQTYMKLLGAPITATGSPTSGVVTINPDFTANQPPVTTCDSSGTCTNLPAQSANFVYLRTGPSANASLLNDPLLRPDATPGTTQASDWSNKAVTGHEYVVAGHQGDWTAIWFDGQKAWFYNPNGNNTVPAGAKVASVPKGKSSVALYGRAFPDQSAYPSGITFDSRWTPTPLTTWTFSAGQSYAVVGEVQASNYYARYDSANVAYNHTLVVPRDTKYLVIDYNHRYLFVKANDVVLSG
jgi:hypothetical protein